VFIQASVIHFAPGLLPRAILVQESLPTVDHNPAFLFPPPVFWFVVLVASLALFDALYRGIFIYMDQRFYYYDGAFTNRQLKII
jgi:hypothetical protein